MVFRAGEQEQTPPEGFESSGSETVLGTEVKYDTPITRTITSANIDRLRFTFGVQALVETTSKGDRNPSEVRLLVQIQRNGGWVTEKDITIKGKTTSQYLASVVVGNLPPRPFSIRMRRMTPDSTTDQLQNKTLWSSYTEIIDVKQDYLNIKHYQEVRVITAKVCGYASVSYFTYVFRRYFGVSPSQYSQRSSESKILTHQGI